MSSEYVCTALLNPCTEHRNRSKNAPIVKICLLIIQLYWGQSIQMTSLKQMKLFHSKIKVQKTITLFQTMSTRTPLLGVQAVRGWIHRMQILMIFKKRYNFNVWRLTVSKQVKRGSYIRFSFIQTSCRV